MIGVGIASVEEIDAAQHLLGADAGDDPRGRGARALEPAWVLVDGNACPRWERPSKAIVAGDAKCRSIAAASIVAKVTRDRIMADHARDYPGYGWETQPRLSDARAYPRARRARPDPAPPPQLRPGARAHRARCPCREMPRPSSSSHTTTA